MTVEAAANQPRRKSVCVSVCKGESESVDLK